MQSADKVFEYLCNNAKFASLYTPENIFDTDCLFILESTEYHTVRMYTLLLEACAEDDWKDYVILTIPAVQKTYDRPTQLVFIDDDGVRYSGIAYKDEVICADCGGIYKIEEIGILKEYEEWIDFSDELY